MRIVSLALAVPHEGIAHAGGEYYLRHVQALLALGHSVLVVAPETPENAAAVPRAPHGLHVRLIRPAAGPIGARVERLRAQISAIRPPLGFVSGIRHDAAVRSALAEADLVEFQWTHVVAAQPSISRLIGPSTPLVGFAHDVVRQGLLRRAGRAGAGPREVLIARARAMQARGLERRLLDRMDAVLTFSEKDRGLLRDLRVRAPIEVVRPPLVTAGIAADRAPEQRLALFVGAFNRDENVLGAEWLVDRVWPRVLQAFPDARLEIVGAHPTDGMRRRAAEVPSVTVTGYVDDLAPAYRRASVALVPLLLGAGVKFKTATAMAWGVPVVATSVGVEGVLEGVEGDVGVALADDPDRFAAAVSAVFRDPRGAAGRAESARRFASRTFGTEGFAERLDDLYGAIRAAGRHRTR